MRKKTKASIKYFICLFFFFLLSITSCNRKSLHFTNKLMFSNDSVKEKKTNSRLHGSNNENNMSGFLKNAIDYLKSVYFIDLDNMVDLANPKANRFTFKNVSEIVRFYYKIEFNDVEFLIKNINNYDSLKDFFLKKKLDKFPAEIITDADREGVLTFIPENKKGLYFCYQKVRINNSHSLSFFQIFNFVNKRIVAFDTEDTVLIHSLLDDADSRKYYVYSESAELLDTKDADKKGVVKIRNYNYGCLYIAGRSPYLVLYRLNLNKIKKRDYKIIAYFNDKDAQFLKIFGIIKSRYSDKLKNSFELKIITFDNITLFSRKIDRIGPLGNFELDIRKDFLPKNDLTASFYSNNIKICDYKLNIFNDNYLRHINNDNDQIKLLEDAVFDTGAAVFSVHNALANNIDFISYSISSGGKNELKGTTKKITNNRFEIHLPEQNTLYKIGLELILKDGTLVEKMFNVNKYSIKAGTVNVLKNEKIVVLNDDFNTNRINFTNPFVNASGLCAIYNNDIESYFKIDLKSGINTIYLDNKSYMKPNLKTLIIINDLDHHNTIYTVKKSYNINSVMNLLNSKFSDKIENIRIDTLLNKNLYDKKNEIYYQGFNNKINYNDYLFEIFYGYNDFLSPERSADHIYKGEKIVIDSKFKNFFSLGVNENQDCTIGFYFQGADSKIYYNFKNITRKKIIQSSFHGPENFSYENKPDFRLNIKNITDDNLSLDVIISANNGIINRGKSSIQLKPFETGFINFNIEKYKYDLPIDLGFQILKNNNNIFSFNKRLNDNIYYPKRVVEISGSLIENGRAASSYFIIPGSITNDFNIELYLSSNNFITLYKNNPSFNEFKLNYFELRLSEFLNNLVEKKYYSDTDIDIDNLCGFYLKDKGFKRFITDKQINLEATLLFLLCYVYVKNNDLIIPVNAVIKNLINNYYSRMLNSDFCLFVLAEYGYFFDEITPDYLSRLKDKKRVFFYYKYFNRFNLKFR
ncbi:MAG: hypothetical protein JXB50_10880, partial [Spirochaetes bacterium]|nr:hypothetical protein [Spirochaetota bacterium]